MREIGEGERDVRERDEDMIRRSPILAKISRSHPAGSDRLDWY